MTKKKDLKQHNKLTFEEAYIKAILKVNREIYGFEAPKTYRNRKKYTRKIKHKKENNEQ